MNSENLPKKISKPHPKKKDEDKFTTTLQIRLSEKEKATLQEKADEAGMPMARYIRSSIISVRDRNRSKIKSNVNSLALEVRRVGINLNQLAKWANTYKSTADTLTVIGQLREIEAAISRLQSLALSKDDEGGGDVD